MEYEMKCEDGFMIKSKNKEEAASVAAMHITMMHPNEKVSGKEIMKMIKPAKSMEM